jgi:hypothetical protein
MKRITKIQAIQSLVPNAEVVIRGDVVEWIQPSTAPVTDEQIEAEYQRLLIEPQNVKVVSMRQARLALLQAGLLSSVEEAVAAGDEAGKITWEYATEVRRDDPLVNNLSAALDLTEGQLDNLFSLASTL